ncbi:LuxR C-terminal-related transcriptional regulator [Streptomyces sp. NPDC052042]|uniref:helix-turn-helix transcriptional regulator n=1 Tax=Streptomyces sp. NPDC052042 TaxID=3365683 RepID=UPI0037CE0205
MNKALAELGDDLPARRDVMAFRILVESMIGEDVEQWVVNEEEGGGSDSLNVVALCVQSIKKWHEGDLIMGLWLNQSAMRKSRDVIPMWKLYAKLLLAKKLIEIHVSQQAIRVIDDMRTLIDGAGLLAFSSLPGALLATLDLQKGNFTEAIGKAHAAISLSDRHGSAVSVKLALSVSAMAHIRLGEADSASQDLAEFHRRSTYYAYPDSIARAAFAEIVLAADRDGAGRAVELMHAKWPELATTSGCLVEDPARVAWMVMTARAAGDRFLAERSLRAVEELARSNPDVPAIESAAQYARSAWLGRRLGHGVDSAPEEQGPVGRRGRSRGGPGLGRDVNDATSERADRPAALTQREIEIARYVTYGLTNQQIARELELSHHTVNYHLRNIFRKLSITSRVRIGPILALLDRHEDS